MRTHTCPRCGGGIPNDLDRGRYPGALSRLDNKTEICSDCGVQEALEDFSVGSPAPRSTWLKSSQPSTVAEETTEGGVL